MASLIAVHTGAGNSLDETKYQKIIKEACMQGKRILKNGGSALDACEAAIIVLENSGNTNAGYGSNLTWDGKIECDASIMDSKILKFGACTNVSNVKNPIQLARKICEKQTDTLTLSRIPPMILAGEGASNYAHETGIILVDPDSLKSQKAIKCYEHYKEKVKSLEHVNNITISPLDTVGAICIDSEGNCSAGCSSGGLILKVSGRVGQAATYGAGCWAQKTDLMSVATCTTGNGEYIMKTLLAREIANDLLASEDPITAMHQTFKQKFLQSELTPTDKKLFAGALSLVYDPNSGDGELLWSHTTKYICLGYMTTQQNTPKFIFSSLPSCINPGESVLVSGQRFRLHL